MNNGFHSMAHLTGPETARQLRATVERADRDPVVGFMAGFGNSSGATIRRNRVVGGVIAQLPEMSRVIEIAEGEM